MAPSAMARPSFHVMSRCVWTWAFAAQGPSAMAPATNKPAFVNMKESSRCIAYVEAPFERGGGPHPAFPECGEGVGG
jgi:hypothetical protein